ncbi:MAG TPA: hypothetical protein VKA70_17725 [Blastocatellia bacterium]|nr:hypothetical protein [Blastocatellia bacterium]
MNCPGFERLIDHLDGRLTGGEGGRIAAHLAAGCRACAETRDWYVSLMAVAAGDDSCEPPPWVLKRAIRLFEVEQARLRLVERVRNRIASLVFDSLTRPAVAGVRSTETANRQLLYRAGAYSIDLQVAPSDQSRADLTGQVLKEGETAFESVAGLSIEISREDEPVYAVTTNEMGEFKIKSIQQGEYDLSVETPEGSVSVQGLPIAHS